VHISYLTDDHESEEESEENTSEEIVFGTIISFLECPALQSLSIYEGDHESSPDYFESVREFFRTKYRHRRIELRLFGKALF